ncbi:MAG: L,D-transpeptidase [Bacillota bacterium]|nr:L,D-transpeptidase [Bacillota bacterium]
MKKSMLLIFCIIIPIVLLLSGCTHIPGKSEADVPHSPDSQSASTAPDPGSSPSPASRPFSELAPSATMSFEQLIADDGTRNNPPDPATLPPPDTYLIEIDLVNQIITAYTKGASGEYDMPYRYMICSTGKSGYSTPAGTFKMGGQKVRFGYFTEFGVYAQYWTQVVSSIYIHSVLYGTRSGKYLRKSSYTDLGKRVSHGCIRMLTPDAKWIYENCAPGTTVVITGKKAPDPELKQKLVPPPIPY